ncbi:MAG TPA: FAD-binding oxidoreductase [Actinomycetota bacterium]|nr:FAD-binding oxidoreductase [Actinomycetota bacterium]
MEPLDSLARRLPPGAVSTHPGELGTRSHDRWALALLREARGDRVPPPAAVVFPSSTEEVAAVLAWAAETATPVVPRGAGLGPAGGAQALPGGVVLDLSRMDRVLAVDPISQTAHAEAGVLGADLEEALGKEGLTVGPLEDSLALCTVGGWVASRAPLGPAGRGPGEAVLGLTVVLAGGEVVRLPPLPWPGPGPDPRSLLAGSEGTLGVVTEVVLSVSRAPTGVLWEVFRPSSFESGSALVRAAVQRGFEPLVVGVFDREAAAETFADADAAALLGRPGPLVVLGFDAGAPAAEPGLFELRVLARELGANPAPLELGEHWWAHRGDLAERHRAVMGEERALGPGVVVDLLPAAGLWRRLPRLYEDVRGALRRHAESVTCRLVRATRSGAELEFSFLLRAPDDEEAEERCLEAWAEAAAACREAGGTVLHRGVGLRGLPFVGAELDSALPGLGRLRRALDPQGLLNPGKLLPEELAVGPPPAAPSRGGEGGG